MDLNLKTTTFWFHGDSPEPPETQRSNHADLQQQVPVKTVKLFYLQTNIHITSITAGII